MYRKILVIDDSPERLEWFKTVLEDMDPEETIEVFEADTDIEALDYFRRYVFDLAFFDHDLGMASPMNGSDIASQILNNPDEFLFPKAVWVHSSNFVGARNIESKFESAGLPCRVESFNNLLGKDRLQNFKYSVESMIR